MAKLGGTGGPEDKWDQGTPPSSTSKWVLRDPTPSRKQFFIKKALKLIGCRTQMISGYMVSGGQDEWGDSPPPLGHV